MRLVLDRLAVESFDTRAAGATREARVAFSTDRITFAQSCRSCDASCVICAYSGQATCGNSCDDPSCVTWCDTCAQYASCVGICA
ncbi:MAG TPA: hypothetical protein VEX86_16860 [Longimicrobium sp.]|nr:hypothetical protein [Longimicrobium sp.]